MSATIPTPTQQTPPSGVVRVETRTTVAVLPEDVQAAARQLASRYPEHTARVQRAAGLLLGAEGPIVLDLRGPAARVLAVGTALNGHDLTVTDWTDNVGECDCLDWHYRREQPSHRGHCKHLLAAELLRMCGVLG